MQALFPSPGATNLGRQHTDPLIDAIMILAEEDAKSGEMLGSSGLGATDQGARVKLSGDKITVIDRPFTEAREIIGGYAQLELASKQEAIESAVSFMELHKKYWPGWEGETEIRAMLEPGDCARSPTELTSAANRQG